MSRFGALIAACIGLVAIAQADDKVKPPTAEEQQRASKLIRELFKAEYAKTTTAAKTDLAKKLFQNASETRDDPPSQFVLLRETAELAAVGNTQLALEACAALIDRFEGPSADVLEPSLKLVAAKAAAGDPSAQVAAFAMARVEDALAADEIETATRLLQIADATAQRSKSVRLARQAQSLAKDIEIYKQNLEKVSAAAKAIQANPNDAEACLVLGQHFCFLKGDWARGLPLLTKSSDARLKAIAGKDLDAAAADDEATGIAVADLWYDHLPAIEGYPKKHVQMRIHGLYSKAFASAAGLAKTKIEKRLDELDKALEGKWDYGALWPEIRKAGRAKTYATVAPMGGAFGDKDYTELFSEGGILIGLNYTLRKFGDKDLIDCFQPIYLTSSGEKLGAARGNFKAAKMLTLKAKSGYAIGKMAVRGGGLLGGLNVRFMRIDVKGLKAEDNYESGWIGHKDVPDSPFLGDGRLIIGIHGKLQPEREGGGICSIGLYVLGDPPVPRKK